jgi:hypothetical protein
VLYVWWRYRSEDHGAFKRDAPVLPILSPIAMKLAGHDEVDLADVENVASLPYVRPILYDLLDHYGELDVFPDRYLTIEAQAEGMLANWMIHPNELGAPPLELEVVDVIERTVTGRRARFVVLRFLMPDDHWAAREGWQLGVVGPFVDGAIPYRGEAAAFARAGDRADATSPEELADWWCAAYRDLESLSAEELKSWRR